MSGFGSNVPEGTHGQHNSRLANAADPRIDSDRDHRAAPGNTTGLQSSGFESSGIQSSGLESSRHTTGVHEPTHHGVGTQEGAFGTTGANRGVGGPASKTGGPHNSNLLNKADPRVDSDRDNSKNMGLNPQRDATTDTLGGSTGRTTHGTTHGDTLGSTTGRTTHGDTLGSTTHGRTTGAPEGTHGPHSSRAANAADPRVDSDRDHRAAHGKTTGTTGTSGLGSSTAPNTRSTGPAPKTAGPHKSDLLNKLDPRVDSNLDGSKTVGGDKTHSH
ncbi:unnamed protein product [Clonostachys rosea f. rosea IK726]|uniref:Uncharacterized protein n=2 Tax=Bionectria ochroleuca TaxID=29856 RepID=A0A0B7JZH0_BIOOC|nr:unnamed protein product [Clonostachys rosea f. rosea IK726]